MKKSFLLGALCALVIFIFGPANAAYIVDTGPAVGNTSNPVLSVDQYLAAQFSIAAAATVTGIEGWMQDNGTGDGTIAIYSDSSGLPDSELHSTTFSSTFSGPGSPAAAWVGASGLSWRQQKHS